MAVQVRPSSPNRWRRYAKEIRRRPEEIAEIMQTAAATQNPYPHIRLRFVHGKSAAYVPDTGLSVWEIAWLSNVYRGDLRAVAEHLSLSGTLVQEAFTYATEHRAEIDPLVQVMEEASEERLRAIMPGMTVVEMDIEPSDELRA